MSKPAAKPAAKPAEAEAAPAKGGNKKKIIIISVLALAIGGGAGWYFTRGHAPEGEHAKEEVKAEPLHEPIFVPLGENFTVNLQREEGDQYLQAGITLKILQPELEEKIKKAMPEIKSKLLFLLSSKLPSELQTAEGKKKLVAEIIAEVDSTLGLGAEPVHASAPAHGAEHGDAAHEGAAASAPVAPPAAPAVVHKTKGVVDVLFTSFIIQ